MLGNRNLTIQSNCSPYNIRKISKENYAIDVALAGFNKNDAKVKFEDNINWEIIHKGISQRQFTRSFLIADDVKVNSAELKDNLLTIFSERIIPEHKNKKLIKIK